jgi:hypothetical protein
LELRRTRHGFGLLRRQRIAAIAAAAVALALPATVGADPGTPGVEAAQDATYPSPPPQFGPEVLGEPPTTPPATGEPPPEDLGEAPDDPQVNAEPTVAGVTPVDTPPKDGDGVTSLPFTGLVAAYVVGAALLLLAAGATMRRFTRQRPGA